METNENCSTEEVNPLILKEIEQNGFKPTWEKHNEKHKKYLKTADWISGLTWVPFIAVLIVLIVKFSLAETESFSDLDLIALSERRTALIKDLTLWGNLTAITFVLSISTDRIPEIIKNYSMAEWINGCGTDLSIYLKRKREGSQNLPVDMGVLTDALYYNKHKEKNKLKFITACVFCGLYVILLIIIFASIGNAVECYVDVKIWQQIGQGQAKPDVAPMVPFIVAVVLEFIAEFAEKVIALISKKTIKNWAETV